MPQNDLPDVFPLVSKRKLCSILGYDFKNLENIAKKAGRYYKPYTQIVKGKSRLIDRPVGQLKIIQKLILKRILIAIPLPLTMLGGVKGRSIKENASYHTKQAQVITLDLRDCFPKTNDKEVFAVYKRYGCSDEIASLLTKLTTFQHRLPQGAPTSSMLVNLVLLPLHQQIEGLAKEKGLNFTIYVDDITISGNNAVDVIGEIIDLIHENGYGVRRHKIRYMPANTQQIVTGLVVNKRVGVPKSKKQQIIQDIMQLSDSVSVDEQKIKSLLGSIAYVKSIDIKDGTFLENLARKNLKSF